MPNIMFNPKSHPEALLWWVKSSGIRHSKIIKVLVLAGLGGKGLMLELKVDVFLCQHWQQISLPTHSCLTTSLTIGKTLHMAYLYFNKLIFISIFFFTNDCLDVISVPWLKMIMIFVKVFVFYSELWLLKAVQAMLYFRDKFQPRGEGKEFQSLKTRMLPVQQATLYKDLWWICWM